MKKKLINIYQTRFWLDSKINPNSNKYNIPLIYQLQGNLDVTKLRHVLTILVTEIYPDLNIYYREEGEFIYQYSRATIDELEIIDYSNTKLTNDDIFNKISQLCQYHFNIENGPIYQFHLLKISQQDFFLILNFHHIGFDGASAKLFIDYLSILYNNHSQDDLFMKSSKKNEHEVPHYQLEQEEIDSNFWKKILKDKDLSLTLPFQKEKVEKNRTQDQQHFSTEFITKDMLATINRFNKANRISLFIFLSAVYTTLLYRYSHQNNIIISYPINCRPRNKANAIECYVNNLPLSVQYDEAITFIDVINQVKNYRRNTIKHQNYPTHKLIADYRKNNQIREQDLLNISISPSNADAIKLNLDGIKSTGTVLGIGIQDFKTIELDSLFDVNLVYCKYENFVQLRLDYNARLYNKTIMNQFLTHFINSCNSLIQHCNEPIEQVSFLTRKECEIYTHIDEQHLLETRNAQDIIFQITERCQINPKNIAVIDDNIIYNYKQLNALANHLADKIISVYPNQITTETKIGVCLERNVNLIVSLLAILKINACYVPIDPDFPLSRIHYILNDSNSILLLTDRNTANKLANISINSLTVDNLELDHNYMHDHKLTNNINKLCCVLYTSGSTGKPKGVMLSHKNILNYINWIIKEYRFEKQFKVLFKTPYTFDVSLPEIFATLISGSTMVIAKQDGHKDVKYLENLINRHQISLIQFVPSMLSIFIEHVDIEKISSLKYCLVSGEVFPRTLHDTLLLTCPNTRFDNLYGPTEAGYITYWPCHIDMEHDVPIGKPIGAAKLYVLDQYLNLVPYGVPGELWVSGPSVSLGYLNKPELTNERFISNKFIPENDKKYQNFTTMYQTGDLVILFPNGVFHYLRRDDDQIKIHGLRVELNEIEQNILQCPGIKQAAVVISKEHNGRKIIACYYSVTDSAITQENLMEYLRNHLPEYMLPHYFFKLSSLPITQNGKIDRLQLQHKKIDITPMDIHVKPMNDTQKSIFNVWKTLFLNEKISIHDNFFRLGGDSFLAIKLANKLESIDYLITLKQIIENPTIFSLAALIDSNQEIMVKNKLYVSKDTKKVYPIAPPQSIFFKNKLINYSFYNVIKLIKIKSNIDIKILKASMALLREKYDVLRIQFVKNEDNSWWQKFDCLFTPPLIQLDCLQLNIKTDEKLLEKLEEINHHIEIISGSPWLIGTITNHSYGYNYIFILVHHMLADGISNNIMAEDLLDIYQKLIAGKKPKTISNSISYQGYNDKILEYTTSSELNDEIPYWLNILQAKHHIPTDKHATTSTRADIKSSIILLLSKDMLMQTNKIFEKYSDLNMHSIMLYVMNLTFAKLYNVTDFCIYTMNNGRFFKPDEINLLKTVGLLVSTFPARLTSNPNLDHITQIRVISKQLESTPNCGLGYMILKNKNAFNILQNHKITTEFNYFKAVSTDTIEVKVFENLYNDHIFYDPRNLAEYLLYIRALEIDHNLLLEIKYCSKSYLKKTIKSFLEIFKTELLSILSYLENLIEK